MIFANLIEKLQLSQQRVLIRNRHFWIILTITAIIIFIYYQWKALYPGFSVLLFAEFRLNYIGSLLLIPFIYAACVFWWRGALIIWLISEVAILPLLLILPLDALRLFRNLAISSIPIAVVSVITLELKWREKDKRLMADREKERQSYIAQILKAQEIERRRIAQELHDDTTQVLLAVASDIQTLILNKKIKIDTVSKENMESIRETLLRLAEDTRRLSLDLRPSILDTMGFLPSIMWLVDTVNRDDNPNAKLLVEGIVKDVGPEDDVTIFRIVQEALNNARRHSKANDILVTLEYTPKCLNISVKDNGTGFILPEKWEVYASEEKSGIIGMRERAEVLGSTLHVNSEVGKGTSISVKVYLP